MKLKNTALAIKNWKPNQVLLMNSTLALSLSAALAFSLYFPKYFEPNPILAGIFSVAMSIGILTSYFLRDYIKPNA